MAEICQYPAPADARVYQQASAVPDLSGAGVT